MKNKKMILGVVAAAICLSLIVSGCAKVSTGQNSSITEIRATITGNNTEKRDTDKYNPVIEMTTVSSLNTMVQFEDGDSIDNNVWTRQIEQDYGIKVKRIWSVTSSQEYEQKLNLMIASGDIPDFFMVSPIQFNQLNEAGLLEDLSDAYDKHASSLVKQMMKEAGPEVLQSATINGKLMALPWTGLAKESVPVIWIRQDWMNQLNLSEPRTMDDLIAISSAFANKDPDGNGKKDTFGFIIDRDLYKMHGFFNAYHAYPGIWIKDHSGKLVFGSIQPEMKTALGKLREMYSDGQIDPEYAVKSPPKSLELIGENKAGILLGDLGQANWPLSAYLPGVEWQAYAVPAAVDPPVKLQHELNIFNNYWVVKKGTKNPEAVLKMAELFVQIFYFNSDEDKYYQFIQPMDKSTSAIWMTAPIKLYRPFNNLENYLAMEAVRKGEKSETELTFSQKQILDGIEKYNNGDESYWWASAQSGENGSGRIIKQYLENNQYMPDEFITIPTMTMTQRSTDLIDFTNEIFTKIIMGTIGLDEFEKYVTGWKAMGGDLITQEVNDWYSKQ